MAMSPTTSTPSEPTMQTATVEDIATIKAMVNAAYSVYVERMGKPPAPMSEDWAQTLQTHNVLVLRDNNQIVGSITFHVAHESNSLKIDNVVVHSDMQGHGYGRFLIKHVETEAQQHGLPSVTLFTNAKMIENIGMYRRMGFVETGMRVEEGFERVYFCKRL
ncbi:unnamed protein product [Penicillium salamii]|uniref:N-acetyltransferase domain-containing protein n=1 Tax=Penicillium salamii TaxID=1612424 RepID=A0A9W4I8Q0_9EURO|nr:unnamed protein product [Penicillium salamii]CAG8264670.1 unnamed protein product [Penicillium salamii]CAG8377533.1 unnamed protein product [Penicillium salamii]CAG8426126.1 unnamed protein product [Penicillium salamii]